MKYIICLYALLILSFASHGQILKKNFTINYEKTLQCNGLNSKMCISTDSNFNLIIEIIDTSIAGYLYSLEAIEGCGNCYIPKDSLINEILLSKEYSCKQFIIEAYVNTSTYGGKYLFLLWNDGSSWNIYKTNFHKYEIKDIGNDGIYEIVDYAKSIKGESYRFLNGSFQRFNSTVGKKVSK